MAQRQVKLPNGQVVTVNAPDGATDEQLLRFVKREYEEGRIGQTQAQPEDAQVQQESGDERTLPQALMDVPLQGIGTQEAILSMASGAIAEPLAGLWGIGNALFGGAEAGAEAVENAREALTYTPRTEAGRQRIGQVSNVLQPIGEAIQGAEQVTGDLAMQASRALGGTQEEQAMAGALGSAVPAGILEMAGLKSLRSSTLRRTADAPISVKSAVAQASPTVQQLKSASNALYRQLDDSGVRIKPNVYDNFVTRLTGDLVEQVDQGVHPKSFSVLRRLQQAQGEPKSFTQLNNLRKLAADAAFTPDPADGRIGKIILNRIDEGIDRIAEASGGDARGARELWRRARVAESIGDMVENASVTASGFENGLRIEARKILRSKKRQKGFTKSELDALRQLEQGSTAQNAAKFLGKFGISEGQATSMLGSAISGTVGAQMAGPAGAIGLPMLGQLAKKTASRLTGNKAKFASQLARAGGDARAIARAYMKNTPKSAQRVEDLTQLLLDPNITPDSIAKINANNKLIQDAKYFATKMRERAERKAAQGAMLAPTADAEENENE